jgi:hypothetical protein
LVSIGRDFPDGSVLDVAPLRHDVTREEATVPLRDATVVDVPHAEAAGPREAAGKEASVSNGSDGAIDSARDAQARDAAPVDSGVDSGPFSPAVIPGLVLWLDANQGVAADAGGVSLWRDQSGFHNDASQSMASIQPTFRAAAINGLPGVHFDATAGGATVGNELSVADAPSLQWGTGDFYLLVVGRSDNTFDAGLEAGIGTLFHKTADPDLTGVVLTANIINGLSSTGDLTGLACSTSSTVYVSVNTPYNDGVPHAFAMQRAGQTLDLRVDGASVGTTTATPTDVSAIGSVVSIGGDFDAQGIRLDGDIAEMIAVEGTLAVTERTALESYVLRKYALE